MKKSLCISNYDICKKSKIYNTIETKDNSYKIITENKEISLSQEDYFAYFSDVTNGFSLVDAVTMAYHNGYFDWDDEGIEENHDSAEVEAGFDYLFVEFMATHDAPTDDDEISFMCGIGLSKEEYESLESESPDNECFMEDILTTNPTVIRSVCRDIAEQLKERVKDKYFAETTKYIINDIHELGTKNIVNAKNYSEISDEEKLLLTNYEIAFKEINEILKE